MITNYLTRMRCCTKDGWMDLETKGVSPDLGIEKVSAWFSHSNRKATDDKMRFGYWVTIKGMTETSNAIGLDNGCGRCLCIAWKPSSGSDASVRKGSAKSDDSTSPWVC